jgi:hypothetical protein
MNPLTEATQAILYHAYRNTQQNVTARSPGWDGNFSIFVTSRSSLRSGPSALEFTNNATDLYAFICGSFNQFLRPLAFSRTGNSTNNTQKHGGGGGGFLVGAGTIDDVQSE